MLSQLAYSIILGHMTQTGPIRTKEIHFRIFERLFRKVMLLFPTLGVGF